MNEREPSDHTSSPPRGEARTSIHLVLNWTHMGVFVAVAALGLITMNLRFDGIDQRFDDIHQRFDDVDRRFDDMHRRIDGLDSRIERVEVRLDQIEVTLSEVIARLSIVEFIVGGRADAETESTDGAGDSVPDR